jgi:hypothetical protein
MTRALALGLALLVAAGAARAQQDSLAHMEGCFVWGVAGGRVGARNECSRPITMKFMAFEDGRMVEADVPPGGWFDTGAPVGVPTGGYMFTSCPVGYTPSLRFSIENRTAISVSLYNCLPGRPNS